MQILFFFVSCWQLYAIFSPTVILNQTVKEELFNRLSLLKTYVKCIISTCCSRFSFTYLWLRLPLLAHLTFSCKPVYGKRGKKNQSHAFDVLAFWLLLINTLVLCFRRVVAFFVIHGCITHSFYKEKRTHCALTMQSLCRKEICAALCGRLSDATATFFFFIAFHDFVYRSKCCKVVCLYMRRALRHFFLTRLTLRLNLMLFPGYSNTYKQTNAHTQKKKKRKRKSVLIKSSNAQNDGFLSFSNAYT